MSIDSRALGQEVVRDYLWLVVWRVRCVGYFFRRAPFGLATAAGAEADVAVADGGSGGK